MSTQVWFTSNSFPRDIINPLKSGWWYTYPSEKYEFVSWDDEIPNIWNNKLPWFQTTNQFLLVYINLIHIHICIHIHPYPPVFIYSVCLSISLYCWHHSPIVPNALAAIPQCGCVNRLVPSIWKDQIFFSIFHIFPNLNGCKMWVNPRLGTNHRRTTEGENISSFSLLPTPGRNPYLSWLNYSVSLVNSLSFLFFCWLNQHVHWFDNHNSPPLSQWYRHPSGCWIRRLDFLTTRLLPLKLRNVALAAVGPGPLWSPLGKSQHAMAPWLRWLSFPQAACNKLRIYTGSQWFQVSSLETKGEIDASGIEGTNLGTYASWHPRSLLNLPNANGLILLD